MSSAEEFAKRNIPGSNISELIERMKTEDGKRLLNLSREEFAEFHKNNELALNEKWRKDQQQLKSKFCYRNSIWSGGEEIKFKFSDWDVNRQSNPQAAHAIAKQAYTLATELLTDSFNVTMYGKSGTGKTSLAIAMLTKIHEESDKSIMIVSTAELSSLLADQYTYQKTKEKLDDLKRALTEVDVLLLDDFGTEGGIISDLKPVRRDLQNYLYQVANGRFQGKKTTIITTNNVDKHFVQMYDPKIISRLVTKNKDHRILFNDMEDVREV